MKVRETLWKGDRGAGTVFYRLDREGRRISPNLYISYRAEGKEQVVSARTDDLEDAKAELRRLTRNRENAAEGLDVLQTPKTERITVGELLDANLRRAQEKGLASIKQVGYRTATLKALLGPIRAVQFRAEHVDSYKKKRRVAKVSDTSIRHELEILNRAFRYAVERGVLRFAPFIEKPTEDKVREKEIPLNLFPKILAEMGQRCSDSRDFEEWLFLTATRPKGARALRWEWFDSKAWTLTIPAEKGGNARVFAVQGSLRSVIKRRIKARRLDCPFIFHRNGRALDQERVRNVFYEALKAVGLPTGRKAGFTMYDTKKTAAGLLIDSGLSEREAMHFSGHRTPSMFDRYVIKSAERHGEQIRKRDAYMKRALADNARAETDRVLGFPLVSADSD